MHKRRELKQTLIVTFIKVLLQNSKSTSDFHYNYTNFKDPAHLDVLFEFSVGCITTNFQPSITMPVPNCEACELTNKNFPLRLSSK